MAARYELSALELAVLAELKRVRDKGGQAAFTEATTHLIIALAAVLQRERGRARLAELLDLIEAVADPDG